MLAVSVYNHAYIQRFICSVSWKLCECNAMHAEYTFLWATNSAFIVQHTGTHRIANPQMSRVKIHLHTSKGGLMHPPRIFAFPSEFFENISHGYVFGVKESNSDNEKILSLLHDLENQGQTPFCMTFLISGCKHDTKLILVSIHTFSRSRISNI